MEDLITIGTVANTQGHLGEVRCITYSDHPERLITRKSIYLNRENQVEEFHIESARIHKKFVVFKFSEVVDMNQAEALKGAGLQIPRTDIPQLPAGEYYYFELIGLRVETVSGDYLGVIADIMRTGSNDIYVVRQDGRKDVLIPAIKQIVKEINLVNKVVTIELMEGLI